MAPKKASPQVSRLEAALGYAESNHIIFGKLEPPTDSSSASWSSALNGVRVVETSGSGQEPSGSLRPGCLPGRMKSSRPHGSSDRAAPLRQTSMRAAQTSGRTASAMTTRLLQANGDVAVNMDPDACSSYTDSEPAECTERPVAIKPTAREQAQQSVAACYDRELHDAGKCRPCSYFVKKGCKGGDTCTFCHLEHEVRARPCKQKREKCKMQVLNPAQADATAEHLKQVAEWNSLQGRYVRNLMQKCEKG